LEVLLVLAWTYLGDLEPTLRVLPRVMDAQECATSGQTAMTRLLTPTEGAKVTKNPVFVCQKVSDDAAEKLRTSIAPLTEKDRPSFPVFALIYDNDDKVGMLGAPFFVSSEAECETVMRTFANETRHTYSRGRVVTSVVTNCYSLDRQDMARLRASLTK
jgi:hypothetical protein